MRPFLALLLIALFLSACQVDSSTPRPTRPSPSPVPTRGPSPTPTPFPTPTPTPPPPAPLGLNRLWSWTAQDILTGFLAHDLDGDGRPEIAVASYDRWLYLVDGSGTDLWAVDTGGSVFALAAADLDGDGRPELLVGSEDGGLRVLSAEGALLWGYSVGGRVTAVAGLDVDGNGRPEVLAGARPGSLAALRADGSLLWREDTPGAPTAFLSLGGVENRSLAVSTEEGIVLGVDEAGISFWREQGHGYIRGLADLEGGPLFGGRDGVVRALTQAGEPMLDASFPGPVATVAAVDLDGDGRPEVLAGVAGEQSALVALDLPGKLLWRAPTGRGVWALALPDLEGDGRREIAAGTDGGEILVLDEWGRPRGQTWVPFRVHGLLAVDLDADGYDELLARASNHLYVFAGGSPGEQGEQQPLVGTLERWPADAGLRPAGEGEVSLVAVGDVMLGRAVEERTLVYGPEFPFAPLISLLRQADITTGNLEGVLACGGTPLQKSYTFRAHPGLSIAGLQAAGFDLVALANNHSVDFGPAALGEMMAAFKGAGIATVGAGPDAYAAVILEAKGLRIAFLARNAAVAPQEGVAWAEAGELRQAVAQARAQADLVIVHLHAGVEYSGYADETQRALARAAADGGAALVVGHHSHAPQEVEWIGRTLVAYSLGDFVFDIDDHDIARDGVVLRVLLSRQGVEAAEWIPVRIVDDVQPRPRAGAGGGPVIERIPGE